MSDSGTFSEIFKACIKSTTVKGASRIVTSESVALRVLWFSAVVVGLSLSGYQVGNIIRGYLQLPTVTKLEHLIEKPDFPDITVCSLNPIVHGEDYGFNMSITDFNSHVYKALYVPQPPSLPYGNIMRLFEGVETSPDESAEIRHGVLEQSVYFQNFRLSDVISGDDAAKFFMSCIFYDWEWKKQVYKCDNTTVRVKFFPDHLMCYTLSLPEGAIGNIRGFSGILYLGRSETSGIAASSHHVSSMGNGAKVTVHQRDTPGLPLEGVTVGAGFDSTIHISELQTSELPAPYSNCTDREYLSEERGEKYTRITCREQCYQQAIITQCNCIPSAYPNLDYITQDNLTFCGNMSVIESGQLSITDEMVVQMGKKILCRVLMEIGDIPCDCPEQCDDVRYKTSISQAPWPMKSFYLSLYDRYIRHSPVVDQFSGLTAVFNELLQLDIVTDAQEIVDLGNQIDEDLVRKSTLQVNVVFKDKLIEVVSEQVAVSWDVLLANIGGALNLWVSIGFISVIEMIDLSFKLVSRLFRKTKVSAARQIKVTEAATVSEKSRDISNHIYSSQWQTNYGYNRYN